MEEKCIDGGLETQNYYLTCTDNREMPQEERGEGIHSQQIKKSHRILERRKHFFTEGRRMLQDKERGREGYQ